jgi:hypothetical protein
MYNPNYEFCDELNAPEMCVIMNRDWWKINHQEIREFLGMKLIQVQESVLFIPNEADRTYFLLRWPQ